MFLIWNITLIFPLGCSNQWVGISFCTQEKSVKYCWGACFFLNVPETQMYKMQCRPCGAVLEEWHQLFFILFFLLLFVYICGQKVDSSVFLLKYFQGVQIAICGVAHVLDSVWLMQFLWANAGITQGQRWQKYKYSVLK